MPRKNEILSEIESVDGGMTNKSITFRNKSTESVFKITVENDNLDRCTVKLHQYFSGKFNLLEEIQKGWKVKTKKIDKQIESDKEAIDYLMDLSLKIQR